MASFVSLPPIPHLSPRFTPNFLTFSTNSTVLSHSKLNINSSLLLAASFDPALTKTSQSQPASPHSIPLAQKNLPQSQAKSQSFLSSLHPLKKNKSPEQIADPINQNFQNRYENIVPIDEYETVSPFKAHQLISDTDSDIAQAQNLETVLDVGLMQPSQPSVDYSIPSLVDIIPVGTIILVGLAGASYGIVRQYSEHPQWHLDLWRKFQAFMGNPQETVSENTVTLHDQAMTELKKITQNASRLESKRFDKQDFIHLSLLHIQVMKDTGDYQGIAEYTKQFYSVMAVKKQQEKLHYLEVSHQGSIHQKFYQAWQELLDETKDIQQLRQGIRQTLEDYLSEVKTEEGQKGLKKYAKAINQLLEFPYQPDSLNLYQSLYNIEGEDYQALHTVSTLLSDLSDTEITNLKTLRCFVIAHRDIFDQIGKQIKLPKKYQQPQTYAKMLQYYAMSDRHQASLEAFDQLLKTLKQWYKPYQVVKEIRDEYPSRNYEQPSSFQEKIPGLALYSKYKNRLSNQTTGSTYLDFDQEITFSRY